MLRTTAKTLRLTHTRLSSTVASRRSPLVSTSEAASLIDQPNVRFVDVRDPRQFETAHVPGAANCVEFFTYLAMSNAAGVAHMQRTFERLLRSKGVTGSERLICYEDSLRGMFGASCRAWYVLRTLGHSDVQVLDGGLHKWQRESRPVSTGPEADHAEGTFIAKFDTIQWVGFEDMTKVHPADKLLDVRDQVEWDARSSSPYGVHFAPRMGRLHGATHIEWYNFMQETPEGLVEFKSPAAVRELMHANGFSESDSIVLYCFKGARASNTLMALMLADFRNVRMYFASWNEWSRIKHAPSNNSKY